MQGLVHAGDADLVGPPFSQLQARALREDQNIAVFPHHLSGGGDHLDHGAAACRAIDRDIAVFPGIPAPERDTHQLLLQHDGRGFAEQGEGHGLPRRQMLGGDDAGGGGEVLLADDAVIRARDVFGDALDAAEIEADEAQHAGTRQRQYPEAGEAKAEIPGEEDQAVGEEAQGDHARLCNP